MPHQAAKKLIDEEIRIASGCNPKNTCWPVCMRAAKELLDQKKEKRKAKPEGVRLI